MLQIPRRAALLGGASPLLTRRASAPAFIFYKPVPFLGAVATRLYPPQANSTVGSTGNTQVKARSGHYARDTITSLSAVIPNYAMYQNSIGGTATYSGNIEYPSGTVAATFGGSIPANSTATFTATLPSTIPNGA